MARLPVTKLWLALLLAAGLLLPYQAFGQTPYDVQVGYAFNLTASPHFPSPWEGSSGVTNFIGSPAGSNYDAAAIRIDNTSAGPLLINDVSVFINGVGPFDLWGSFTIPAGGIAILTQTAAYNFDGSDINPISPCGVPVLPGTMPFPTVTVTANGKATTFNDTAHVLDTGGYDLDCAANESAEWRPIGTTGGQGGLPLSPSSVSFGGQLVGSTSAPQVVTLSNTGTGAFTISSMTVSGDFAETNNCPASVAAGSNCMISVTFTPSQTGTRTGTLTVTDDAPLGGTQTVSLMGTGTAPVVSLSPTSLPAFASQAVGTKSPAQTVTLSNTGTADLSVSGITISGANAADFAETNTCGSSVAVNANCTITLTFTPSGIGTRSGSLTISDNNNTVANSTQTLALTGSGSGATATLSTSTVAFGGQNVGTSSSASSVTLTNKGNTSLMVSSITISGSDSTDFAIQSSSTCSTKAGVAAGKSCTVTLVFTPATGGTRSATLTIGDNSVGSASQTVMLTGTGRDFALSVGPKSASLSPGTSANYTLTLTPQGGFNQAIQVTCTEPTGLTESTCSVSPSSVTLNGSTAASVAIGVTTTAPSFAPMVRRRPPSSPFGKPLARPALWLAVLGLLGQASLLSLRRKRRAWVLMTVTALMVVLWASCGGGGGGGSSNPGTAAGTFNITLSASGGNITHTSTAVLTVQ